MERLEHLRPEGGHRVAVVGEAAGEAGHVLTEPGYRRIGFSRLKRENGGGVKLKTAGRALCVLCALFGAHTLVLSCAARFFSRSSESSWWAAARF